MPGSARELSLRPARPGDLDAIVAIERVAFTDPPWSRASFASLVDDPRVVFLVATDRPAGGEAVAGAGAPGGVLGYVVAWVVVDEAEIANLAVAPERRRTGIGRRLLEAAVTSAVLGGARVLYLEVRESNTAARALYGARGFVLAGRRSDYYRNPVEDALVLRLDLRAAASPPERVRTRRVDGGAST